MHISEATRKKAEAAKSYIENMYKMQHQNIQDRLERCDQASGLWAVLTVHEARRTCTSCAVWGFPPPSVYYKQSLLQHVVLLQCTGSAALPSSS